MEPSSELGGIATNKPGYHNSRENLPPTDYSVIDAPDKGGPSDYAAALDWTFPDAQAGDHRTINKYSQRLLASGKDPNDTRLDWMREFFGQADSDGNIEGWDFRYAVPSTSADQTHDWHIHMSFSRNALTNANMDKLIEVLRGDDELDAKETQNAVWAQDDAIDSKYLPWRDDSVAHDPPGTNKGYSARTVLIEAAQGAHDASAKLDQVLAGGATVIVGPDLLKQVMLDPVVVETYAKAIGDQIVGLKYERTD